MGASPTIIDDLAADNLTGDEGEDMFFASAMDVVTDGSESEFIGNY